MSTASRRVSELPRTTNMKKIWRWLSVNVVSPTKRALARSRSSAGNGSAGERSCDRMLSNSGA
jgi:hypothetical protein